jgi:hypothetical protein
VPDKPFDRRSDCGITAPDLVMPRVATFFDWLHQLFVVAQQGLDVGYTDHDTPWYHPVWNLCSAGFYITEILAKLFTGLDVYYKDMS